jgi:hypothetical protein
MYRVLVGNLRKRTHRDKVGVAGRIILKWVIREWFEKTWTGLIWLRIETSGGLFLTR